jgi:hypothetical protein
LRSKRYKIDQKIYKNGSLKIGFLNKEPKIELKISFLSFLSFFFFFTNKKQQKTTIKKCEPLQPAAAPDARCSRAHP